MVGLVAHLRQVGGHLHLVHCWSHIGVAQQTIQLPNVEITDPNRLGLSTGKKSLHGAPGVYIIYIHHVKHLLAIDHLPRKKLIAGAEGYWPMHQVSAAAG